MNALWFALALFLPSWQGPIRPRTRNPPRVSPHRATSAGGIPADPSRLARSSGSRRHAQKVDFGFFDNTRYAATKDQDGFWTATTANPVVPGLHYYRMWIDGV